jgi:hypothetical protein
MRATLRHFHASALTQANYLKAIKGFVAWAKPRRLALHHPGPVRSMELYSVHLTADCHGPAAGRNLLYGWLFFRNEDYEKDLLGLSNMMRMIPGWAMEVMKDEGIQVAGGALVHGCLAF